MISLADPGPHLIYGGSLGFAMKLTPATYSLISATLIVLAPSIGLGQFHVKDGSKDAVITNSSEVPLKPASENSDSERSRPSKSDGEAREVAPGVIKLSSGVFLELAVLSQDRITEVQAISQPGQKEVSEIPEFELAPKEIRTVQEAFARIKFISMVEYPRFYFFDGDYWYFSGGRRAVRADDFSDGYRVSQTGQITAWYERK